jgi:PKD domain-containing protein
MIANPSSSTPSRRHVSESTDRRGVHALLVTCLTFVVAACGADDLTAPRVGTNVAHPSITVTPNYSTFDKRSEFDGAGVVDYLNGFDEFNVDGMFFPQDSPWTTSGVTYTSASNVVLGRVIELGIQSAAISTDFGAPITGTVADSVPVTLFGANLMLIGDKVPVALLLRTNLGNYSFNLDVPLAADGQRFFGIALSKPGEYVTGFQFSVGGSGSALLLDDVAVGHMGAPNTNADPVASAGGSYVGEEGSAVALALSGTDSDGDALTFSWDLGDGTTGSGAVPPANHVYADNGTYVIMLAVDDGRGGADTARTTATISNVAPSLAAFSIPATPMGLTPGGITVPVSSSFTDPGTVDTHTASLDCGSGVTAQSEVVGEMASSACSFSSAGVYSIRLTVRDKDGGSDTKLSSAPIVVFDPAGGRLTGGGWVASPAGAVAFAPTAAGKLTFSLNARYEPGSSIPTGKAELNLTVGKLEFRSTSLDWLVATEASAQLQGRGTVNGNGDYAFSVVAMDGQSTGAVRIRIWHRTSGTLLYDSRPGAPLDETGVTALGGGSIQLHAR